VRRSRTRVNHWLARDAGLGAAAIQKEVEEWDVTGFPENSSWLATSDSGKTAKLWLFSVNSSLRAS